MVIENNVEFLSWVSFENDFSRATECRLNIDTYLLIMKGWLRVVFKVSPLL
ncbi:Uncharacterised protein [Salmonella enterica subsp. enterica]|nr:hypothetical protein SEEM1594_02503 [Salmonella enterica subsp. enterica serovar Muenchen str. baa1594]SUG76470.1 Uncharacterised protein [Salmonella enterica subsp. enterica]